MLVGCLWVLYCFFVAWLHFYFEDIVSRFSTFLRYFLICSLYQPPFSVLCGDGFDSIKSSSSSSGFGALAASSTGCNTSILYHPFQETLHLLGARDVYIEGTQQRELTSWSLDLFWIVSLCRLEMNCIGIYICRQRIKDFTSCGFLTFSKGTSEARQLDEKCD